MTRAELTERKPVRILRLPAVKDLVGLSRSSIYQRVADGVFPRPIALGGRAVGWIDAEVDDWVARKIEASRKGDGDPTEQTS